MKTELQLLKQVAVDMKVLKKKIDNIEASLGEIDEDLHEVRPEYLEKLEQIEKGGFISKGEFEKKFNVRI